MASLMVLMALAIWMSDSSAAETARLYAVTDVMEEMSVMKRMSSTERVIVEIPF